jgi:hypothetical protein
VKYSVRLSNGATLTSLFALSKNPRVRNAGTWLQKITEERLGRASLPFFLRPFNGCVPQPSKKRRLFDSHNPNYLMVAELRATISKVMRPEYRGSPKSKEEYLLYSSTNFGFH